VGAANPVEVESFERHARIINCGGFKFLIFSRGHRAASSWRKVKSGREVPPPAIFVSVAFKGFRFFVSPLNAILAGWSVSVADKGVRGEPFVGAERVTPRCALCGGEYFESCRGDTLRWHEKSAEIIEKKGVEQALSLKRVRKWLERNGLNQVGTWRNQTRRRPAPVSDEIPTEPENAGAGGVNTMREGRPNRRRKNRCQVETGAGGRIVE